MNEFLNSLKKKNDFQNHRDKVPKGEFEREFSAYLPKCFAFSYLIDDVIFKNKLLLK